MARPREFNIEQARESAMNVFWESGYRATSLPDLLAGAGLSRGSLYKAFGSKKKLFIETLKTYDETELQPGIRLLQDSKLKPGSLRIERFFTGAIALVMAGDRRGCLLCNAAVGAASEDSEIAEVVSRMLDDLTKGFAFALQDMDKSFAGNQDMTRSRANALTMSYVGLRVLARSGTPVKQLKSAVKASLLDIAPENSG